MDQHDCTTSVRNCLQRAWNWIRGPVIQIIRLGISVALYIADLVTDIMLALQYHNSGDYVWFCLTMAFVIAPTIIVNIVSAVMFRNFNHRDNTLNVRLGFRIQYLTHFLQLGMFLQYINLFCLLWRGQGLGDHVEFGVSDLEMLEAILESIPQLCIQIHIAITDEQVSHMSWLKVFSMVISLLAAVKAVVMFWYFGNKKTHENKRFTKCTCDSKTQVWIKSIHFTLWKVVELFVRVVAIGMCTSGFQHQAEYIIYFVCYNLLHWLILTIIYTYLETDTVSFNGIFLGCLHMFMGLFSMTLSLRYSITFWVNTMLTLAGNITMVTLWYNLREGQYVKITLVLMLIGLASWSLRRQDTNV
ncbi:XK-related protein 6-like [Branchiostoma floridae]|uniref:XK-related protein n=1 Tax=Branchiostoma floridae TaxID=7739 RepID=A0A9J7LWY4_BRAFL|nr:XK-related protein 6-like [Branchiostoma floridae]